MLNARVKIDKLVRDIIQYHSKSNLEQRQVNWINNKGHFEYIATISFESNGYFPNGSKTYQIEDLKNYPIAWLEAHTL
jgi:hypothetical protein